nr:probable RNA-dependent RNA polymerase 3 [Tanacetum cinerariifolium]
MIPKFHSNIRYCPVRVFGGAALGNLMSDVLLCFQIHLDWDSGKTYVYHCYVSIDGTYSSRELGDDNVWIVQFTDDLDPDMPFDQQSCIADRETISNKISIGTILGGKWKFGNGYRTYTL